MNVIQFPITCFLCNKKSKNKESFLYFDKNDRVTERFLCFKCGEKELLKFINGGDSDE